MSGLFVISLVDASHVAELQMLHAVAVEDLYFIAAHEIHARIRPFRDHKFEVQFEIPIAIPREQIGKLPSLFIGIQQDVSRRVCVADELARIGCTHGNLINQMPLLRRAKVAEYIASDELSSVSRHQSL